MTSVGFGGGAAGPLRGASWLLGLDPERPAARGEFCRTDRALRMAGAHALPYSRSHTNDRTSTRSSHQAVAPPSPTAAPRYPTSKTFGRSGLLDQRADPGRHDRGREAGVWGPLRRAGTRRAPLPAAGGVLREAGAVGRLLGRPRRQQVLQGPPPPTGSTGPGAADERRRHGVAPTWAPIGTTATAAPTESMASRQQTA